jgi:hypothetical protein
LEGEVKRLKQELATVRQKFHGPHVPPPVHATGVIVPPEMVPPARRKAHGLPPVATPSPLTPKYTGSFGAPRPAPKPTSKKAR